MSIKILTNGRNFNYKCYGMASLAPTNIEIIVVIWDLATKRTNNRTGRIMRGISWSTSSYFVFVFQYFYSWMNFVKPKKINWKFDLGTLENVGTECSRVAKSIQWMFAFGAAGIKSRICSASRVPTKRSGCKKYPLSLWFTVIFSTAVNNLNINNKFIFPQRISGFWFLWVVKSFGLKIMFIQRSA